MRRVGRVAIMVLAAWWLVAGNVQAQMHPARERSLLPDPEYAKLSYSYAALVDLDSGGEYSRHDIACHGEMPLLWDDPLRFASFGDLCWSHITLNETPVGDVDVYKVFGTVDVRYEGAYPFLLLGQVGAGLLSDLQEIDGDDARVRGRAIIEYPVSDILALRGGVAYDETLGDDEWHLLGGIRWQPMAELMVDLQYPRSQLLFSPVHGTAFSVQAGYVGDNWTIFDDKKELNLRIKGFSADVAAEFALSDMTWIRLFGGWVTERTVDIWQAERRPVKGGADDGYYMGIALLWR